MLEGVLLLQKPVSIVNDSIALAEIPEISTMGLGCALLHFLGGLSIIDIVTLATLLVEPSSTSSPSPLCLLNRV
jgi:hypothetical protein